MSDNPTIILRNEIASLEAENRDLRERLTHHEHNEAAKFRRVDCLRIGQKYLEHLGRGERSLIEFAAGLSRFVETGDTGGDAKVTVPAITRT